MLKGKVLENFCLLTLKIGVNLQKGQGLEIACPVEKSHIAVALTKMAYKLGAKKVQLYKPYFNRESVELAHANGIKCNVFWSDDAAETKEFLDMGIDTILTNDYNLISQIVQEYKK